jgi:hypothetical protein
MRVIDLGDAERRFLPELVFRPIGTAYNLCAVSGDDGQGPQIKRCRYCRAHGRRLGCRESGQPRL